MKLGILETLKLNPKINMKEGADDGKTLHFIYIVTTKILF